MSNFQESFIDLFTSDNSQTDPPSPSPVSPIREYQTAEDIIHSWEHLFESWQAEQPSPPLPQSFLPTVDNDLDNPLRWDPVLSAPLLEEISYWNDDMTNRNACAEQHENTLSPDDISFEEVPANRSWREVDGVYWFDSAIELLRTCEAMKDGLHGANECTVGWLLDG